MTASLYQKQIVEASRRAAAYPRVDEPDGSARVDNPLCGDEVTMDVVAETERVRSLGFRVRGCALCEASAVWLAEHAEGWDRDDVKACHDALTALLKDGEALDEARFPELAMFAPVQASKSRHRCVTLPVEALDEALADLRGGDTE